MKNKRVLMAMSGGIDSTVAAILLLEQGYELIGATFRTSDCPPGEEAEEKDHGSADPLSEARQLAEQLGIEHHILDFRQVFREKVVSYFIGEYLHGRTPNPCVVCNSTIKWGKLIEAADTLNCNYIATGHYARTGCRDGRWYLRKGVDPVKDQTYFLWTLTQDKLSRTLFPLGELTKPEVREIARSHGYEQLSRKKESQEICFIPDNDYRSFLSAHVENYTEQYGPGAFVDTSGKYLGVHKGFPNYTIGQRKGLGIALGQPMFVVGIHPENNTVVLGRKEELQGKSFYVRNINLMKYARIPEGLEVTARIRYRNEGGKASLYPEGELLRVVFHENADSITPGQSAVFYENEDLVAGGFIIGTEK